MLNVPQKEERAARKTAADVALTELLGLGSVDPDRAARFVLTLAVAANETGVEALKVCRA